jgi:hypothetical protein
MHERNREAVTQLLNDVTRCLTALSTAATAVAAEYAAGDAESSATTSDVYDAFTPTSVPTATGGATPAPTATTMPTGPYATPEPGGHQPGAGNDPDSYSTPVNPGAAVVVAPGTAGEYTIPADNEGMDLCTRPVPQPTN